jgi:hypothetical protein
MCKYNFWEPIIKYVNGKAKSFLKDHELENAYDEIQRSADANKTSIEDYINNLLNETVTRVADKEGKEWNKIRDEFNSHYLSVK